MPAYGRPMLGHHGERMRLWIEHRSVLDARLRMRLEPGGREIDVERVVWLPSLMSQRTRLKWSWRDGSLWTLDAPVQKRPDTASAGTTVLWRRAN